VTPEPPDEPIRTRRNRPPAGDRVATQARPCRRSAAVSVWTPVALAPHSSNDQDVAPPGSWTCNAAALVGVTQYRCHGGGPADGALRVRECCTGFVDHARPAPGGESLGRRRHQIRVGDQLRRALHHYVVPLRREGDRTPRVTLEVSALACGTAGHDSVRAVVPSCPDTGDVRAAVGIDRGEPGGVPARAAVSVLGCTSGREAEAASQSTGAR
jgi:hypothetical protein